MAFLKNISTSPNKKSTIAASINPQHALSLPIEESLMVTIAPPIYVLQVTLLENSKETFIDLLRQHGVEFEELLLKSSLEAMGGTIIEIVQSSAPWAAALSAVICSFLKNCRSRKVTVTSKDNIVVQCEGLSRSDVQKIIETAKAIAVRDDL